MRQFGVFHGVDIVDRAGRGLVDFLVCFVQNRIIVLYCVLVQILSPCVVIRIVQSIAKSAGGDGFGGDVVVAVFGFCC
jgi:hypothetical protein